MATQSVPPKAGNLNLFATALVVAASDYEHMVAGDKPNPTQLAKILKEVKLLVSLCDYEVKKFRSQK